MAKFISEIGSGGQPIDATVIIKGATFSGNTAAQGGAIASENGKLTISGSTFTANFAEAGGAIYTTGGTVEVLHCQSMHQ